MTKFAHGSASKVALISLLVSIIILIFKFVAYWMTSSVGMFSDAIESFVNIASAMFAYIALSIARIPADKNHPYGHGKAEYFSSAIEGTMIIVAAATIVLYAFERLFHPREFLELLGPGIVVSVFAAAMNLGLAVYILRKAKGFNSISLETNAKHLMADVWTTAAVVISLIIIHTFPDLIWVDPVIAICIAVHVSISGYRMLRKSIDGLMDVALPEHEVHEIINAIEQNIPKSASFSSVRTKMQGASRFVDFKLVVDGSMSVRDSHDICDRLESILDNLYEGTTTVIHVEPK